MADDLPPRAAKAAVRRRLLARRAALTDLTAPSVAVRHHVLGASWSAAGSRIAAYVPIGAEPGSVGLLDALAARGCDVLLPVIHGEELEWAAYDGRLVPGPWGLRQPAGPRLGPTALGAVAAVVVPALAVDRRGTRLGRGAGFYDRSLGHVGPGTPLVALLHDGEFVDDLLPVEPHDVPMTAVITPLGGLAELRRGPDSAF